MRLSVLVPAAFSALLAAGSVMAESPSDDGAARHTHRVERRELELKAQHERPAVRVREARATHTRERNRIDRAEPRIQCGDDDCRVQRDATPRAEPRAASGRRGNNFKVDRVAERVNCSPDDTTCGSHAPQRDTDSSKKDEDRQMSAGEAARMRKAFERMLAAICERSGRDCGVHQD